METNHIPLKKQIFAIPNILGYFRIILIPIFTWCYVTAESLADFHIAALLVGISGLTDMLDGKIARRFHLITPLGKALDPIADKLTQAAMALCLIFRFDWMIPLFILLIIKEGFMGIMGIIMLRKGKMLNGAEWFGKVCTAVLYLIMFLLFLLPSIPLAAANIMIGICIAFMLLSLVMYIPVYLKMYKE